MLASGVLYSLLGCAPRQDGLTRLPFNQDVELAQGDQRLLLRLDRGKSYQVHLTPGAGDSAFLTASLCKLDVNQRVDEGDSHCVSEEVAVDARGASAVAIPVAEDSDSRKLGHLALRVFAQGPTPAPVVLRVDESQ